MNESTIYPEWQYKPSRLTKDEIDSPLQVIIQFLQERQLPSHRAIIWNILQAALASSEGDFINANEAAEQVQYCRDLEIFIEAVFVLANNLSSTE